jgi:hypothetical protein
VERSLDDLLDDRIAVRCKLNQLIHRRPSRSDGPMDPAPKGPHSREQQQLKECPTVGDDIDAPNVSWSSGAEVPETFVNHVRRSVPLYETDHDLICEVSDFLVKDDSICYENRVSTGELLRKLARHNARKRARWIAIDVEESMIAKATEHASPTPTCTWATPSAETSTGPTGSFLLPALSSSRPRLSRSWSTRSTSD